LARRRCHRSPGQYGHPALPIDDRQLSVLRSRRRAEQGNGAAGPDPGLERSQQDRTPRRRRPGLDGDRAVSVHQWHAGPDCQPETGRCHPEPPGGSVARNDRDGHPMTLFAIVIRVNFKPR
jgi:hypothetical protein